MRKIVLGLGGPRGHVLAVLVQYGLIFGGDGQIIHFAGVFIHIEQLFTAVAFVVDRVFVPGCTKHAPGHTELFSSTGENRFCYDISTWQGF